MRIFSKRLWDLMLGTVLFSIGIVFMMQANLGFASWEVLHYGIGLAIGMSIGNVSIIVGVIICVIVVWLGEKVGLGTLVNMVLIGVLLDIFLRIQIFPQMTSWGPGIGFLLIGMFTISFGSYFYIKSGFGAGPRDSLMVVIERKTSIPVGAARGIVEVSAVMGGWLLGGPIGIGTLIAAIGMGFCIQIVFGLMRFDATSVRHETIDMSVKQLRAFYTKRLFYDEK